MVEKVNVWCTAMQQTYSHFLKDATITVEPERVMLIERRGGAGEEEYKEECSKKQYSVCNPGCCFYFQEYVYYFSLLVLWLISESSFKYFST